MERRLAAILAADVVASSRLKAVDEKATLATLNAYRRFMDDRIAEHRGRLESADLNRIKRKRPESMAVYDYVLRGKMHHHRATKEDNAEALRLLDKAIELDPEFAEA